MTKLFNITPYNTFAKDKVVKSRFPRPKDRQLAWKNLSEAERRKWDDAHFERLVAQRSKPHSPRGKTGYNIFMAKRIAKLKSDEPDMTPQEALAFAAASWKELSKANVDKFNREAKQQAHAEGIFTKAELKEQRGPIPRSSRQKLLDDFKKQFVTRLTGKEKMAAMFREYNRLHGKASPVKKVRKPRAAKSPKRAASKSPKRAKSPAKVKAAKRTASRSPSPKRAAGRSRSPTPKRPASKSPKKATASKSPVRAASPAKRAASRSRSPSPKRAGSRSPPKRPMSPVKAKKAATPKKKTASPKKTAASPKKAVAKKAATPKKKTASPKKATASPKRAASRSRSPSPTRATRSATPKKRVATK